MVHMDVVSSGSVTHGCYYDGKSGHHGTNASILLQFQ